MHTIDKNAPVMVTGATGYVAGWLVSKLLEEGFTVHAPVRSPDDDLKLKYLNKLADKFPGSIKYFKADLLDQGSYAEAMVGCELVFHTASPFVIDVKDPVKELIEPAKLGTRNVLEQANKTPTVKRVVLTSSCAAIYCDNKELEEDSKQEFTEEDWNTNASVNHQPYSYSKTLAEKEAWDVLGKQDRWDLVVVNPSLVIGPGINPNSTSESFKLIKQFGDGTMKTGAPDWGIGVVDVRDLADAHFNAGMIPEASGRYIISAYNTSFLEMAKPLRQHYQDKYPFPKKNMPQVAGMAGCSDDQFSHDTQNG